MHRINDHTRLSPWEEALGLLSEVRLIEGGCLAKIGRLKLYLPIEVGEPLKEHIGRRIAILKTDYDYKIRVIS